MSKILTAGVYSVMAKVDLALSETPFTVDNCTIMYETNGVFKHWSPNGSLNAFTALVKGVGYIIYLKQTVDVTDEFADATDIGGASLTGIVICNSIGMSGELSQDVIYEELDADSNVLFTHNIVSGDVYNRATADLSVGLENVRVSSAITFKQIVFINSNIIKVCAVNPPVKSAISPIQLYIGNGYVMLGFSDPSAVISGVAIMNYSVASFDIDFKDANGDIVSTISNPDADQGSPINWTFIYPSTLDVDASAYAYQCPAGGSIQIKAPIATDNSIAYNMFLDGRPALSTSIPSVDIPSGSVMYTVTDAELISGKVLSLFFYDEV